MPSVQVGPAQPSSHTQVPLGKHTRRPVRRPVVPTCAKRGSPFQSAAVSPASASAGWTLSPPTLQQSAVSPAHALGARVGVGSGLRITGQRTQLQCGECQRGEQPRHRHQRTSLVQQPSLPGGEPPVPSPYRRALRYRHSPQARECSAPGYASSAPREGCPTYQGSHTAEHAGADVMQPSECACHEVVARKFLLPKKSQELPPAATSRRATPQHRAKHRVTSPEGSAAETQPVSWVCGAVTFAWYGAYARQAQAVSWRVWGTSPRKHSGTAAGRYVMCPLARQGPHACPTTRSCQRRRGSSTEFGRRCWWNAGGIPRPRLRVRGLATRGGETHGGAAGRRGTERERGERCMLVGQSQRQAGRGMGGLLWDAPWRRLLQGETVRALLSYRQS